MLQKSRNELYYAWKTLMSVLSGYTGRIQSQWWDEEEHGWEDITIDDYYDPYYVCLLFRNGKHIPLPLIQRPSDSIFILQKYILMLSKELGLLKKAQEDAILFATSKTDINEFENEFEEELI